MYRKQTDMLRANKNENNRNEHWLPGVWTLPEPPDAVVPG